jgi:hypothetical protein
MISYRQSAENPFTEVSVTLTVKSNQQRNDS